MLLARKVTPAKWSVSDFVSADRVSADALTADFRTHDNTLSFWLCADDSEEELEKAFLALATSYGKLDRVRLVLVDEDRLAAHGIALEATPGKTPVEELQHLHRDAVRLTCVDLRNAALMVAAEVRASRIRQLNRADVKKLILGAVEQGRVSLDALPPKLAEELQ